jgi:hypothetical protein
MRLTDPIAAIADGREASTMDGMISAMRGYRRKPESRLSKSWFDYAMRETGGGILIHAFRMKRLLLPL